MHFIMREQTALAGQDRDMSEALRHFAEQVVLVRAILDAWKSTNFHVSNPTRLDYHIGRLNDAWTVVCSCIIDMPKTKREGRMCEESHARCQRATTRQHRGWKMGNSMRTIGSSGLTCMQPCSPMRRYAAIPTTIGGGLRPLMQ